VALVSLMMEEESVDVVDRAGTRELALCEYGGWTGMPFFSQSNSTAN
jgi:hypothetical protein